MVNVNNAERLDDMWRLWFKKIFPVVLLTDYSGQIYFRFLYTSGNKKYCRKISGWIELKDGGKIDSHSYMVKWELV